MSLTRIHSEHAPNPIGPYSQAVSKGGVVFLSGQIGMDPKTGKLVNGSLEQETMQVLANLQAVLDAAGIPRAEVAMCSIFLTNMDDFAVVNQLYAEFFDGHKPARQTVEVSRLPAGASVEISMMAMPG